MATLISDNNNPLYGTSVEAITITNGGTGYTVSDSLALSGGSFNCMVNVDGVDGSGTITGATITVTGDGYALSGYTTTGGTGSNAQITVSSLYNGLSTPNGFYRVENHNLGFSSLTQAAGLAFSQQRLDFTPLNAVPIVGAGVSLCSGGLSADKDAILMLNEKMGTCTMTNASPCVVTYSGHGFSGGEEITFSTTGALPTNVYPNYRFYVKYIDINTFNISLTSGGTNVISTTGTQSGVQSLHRIRSSSTKTANNMFSGFTSAGIFIVPFTFDTTYTVDTTASKWSLVGMYGTGSTGSYFWDTVNYPHTAAALSYFTWSNIQMTFNNDELIIAKDKVVVDKTATITGVTSTSGTDYAGASTRYSIVLCSRTPNPPTVENLCGLQWQNPPIASYTLNATGRIIAPTFSSVIIGTPSLRIPYSKKAILSAAAICGYGTILGNAGYGALNESLYICGEIPTTRSATIPNGALSGQKIIVTNISTGWQAGETVYFGPVDVKGASAATTGVISGITGNTITLVSNLTVNIMSGATIFNKEGYGVNGPAVYLQGPANLNVSGVYFNGIAVYINACAVYGYEIVDPYRSKHNISDNCFIGTAISQGLMVVLIPYSGLDILRNFGYVAKVCPALLGGALSGTNKAGYLTIEDNVNLINNTYWALAATTPSLYLLNYSRLIVRRNKFYNITTSAYPFIQIGGYNAVFNDNDFYGISSTSIYGGVILSNLYSSTLTGNTFNKCEYGYYIGGAVLNVTSKNDTFGNLSANVVDVTYASDTYSIFRINDSITDVNVSSTNLINTIIGTVTSVQNENEEINRDRSLFSYGEIVRCGDNLTDQTVHTSGTGKFSMRFSPFSTTTNNLSWSQEVPTGNIQNLTMSVSVWVKINSTSYYGGTYINPTLIVNYDNGTIISSVAINSTDWQLLSVIFTSLTTYGQITVFINGSTDVSGTNSYFYVDDLSVFYPPGTILNLGGLDLWANGLPIVPSISTNINATDVWSVQTSLLNASGSIGKEIVDKLPSIETKTKIIQGLVS